MIHIINRARTSFVIVSPLFQWGAICKHNTWLRVILWLASHQVDTNLQSLPVIKCVQLIKEAWSDLADDNNDGNGILKLHKTKTGKIHENLLKVADLRG